MKRRSKIDHYQPELFFQPKVESTIYGKAMVVRNNDVKWGDMPRRIVGGLYGDIYDAGAYIIGCTGQVIHAYPKHAGLRAISLYKVDNSPKYIRCYDNGIKVDRSIEKFIEQDNSLDRVDYTEELAAEQLRLRLKYNLMQVPDEFVVDELEKILNSQYTSGKTADRYTVVFTGKYPKNEGGFMYLGMSGDPYHPMGIGQHGWSDAPIDRPKYGHLGRRISFHDLSDKCQELIIHDYKIIWII